MSAIAIADAAVHGPPSKSVAAQAPVGNPVSTLKCDIPDWSEQDLYLASTEAATILEQKGFCFIGGVVHEKTRRLAEKEARVLKRSGEFQRVPEEGTEALFGPSASCWTLSLTPPFEDAPENQSNLHEIDATLHEVGMHILSSGDRGLGEVIGRAPGCVHYSKMPEDRASPKLLDPDEALTYVAKASQRKVSVVFLMGPSAAMISVGPREDLQCQFSVMSKSPVVLVYRSDAVLVSMDTKGVAITMEMDLCLRRLSGSQTEISDRLPIPQVLDDWFAERLRVISEGSIEGVPFKFVREAALNNHRAVPLQVVQMHHDLPGLPIHGGGCTTFESSLLAGLDPVTEIHKPRSQEEIVTGTCSSIYAWGGKWDPDEYYDDDPMLASDFKMYCRHFSVLNRNEAWTWEADMKLFGLQNVEDVALDHRSRMLLESTSACLRAQGMETAEIANKDIGFFVGLCGENQYWNFMHKTAKIDKFSAQNMSNAAMVNRLSYYFQCNGPCVCVDTEDSSGLVALDTAVLSIRENRCGPFCFASSCQWIANPFDTILQCAAGVITRSGRTRVWDETADGFSKGEGAVVLMLERVEPFDDPRRKASGTLITGCGTNSKGSSSSLTAPNSLALMDVISRACKDSMKPDTVYDAIEANAGGSRMADIVELMTLYKVMAVDDESALPVPVRSARAIYGNLGPVSGLVGVARSCVLLERALHGPTLHLRQQLDLSGAPLEEIEETSRRVVMPTEVIEARAWSQIVGVSSFGSTGTSCHVTMWGRRPEETMQGRAAKPLSWWPVGDVLESEPPLKGYYIVGTWTAWQVPQLMQEDSPGVYSYVLTMGENNWETFQIWVDEDPDRCLHPTEPKASPEKSVEGPDHATKLLSWLVTGEEQLIRLITEAQFVKLNNKVRQAIEGGGQAPLDDMIVPYVVAYNAHRKVPEEYRDVEEISEMPTINLNKLMGKPGDQYVIQLHVRGKFKRVEWKKLEGTPLRLTEPVRTPPFVHKYHVIGDHTFWQFEEMMPADDEDGVYYAAVQLLKETTNFQIYRDADWEQGFYPVAPKSGPEITILGPDEGGYRRNWQISGNVGDRFRVEFRRRRVGDDDQRSISWQFLTSESVDFKELSKSHRYYYVSSATGFEKAQEMTRSEDGSRFSFDVLLGRTGMEQFQLLLNANFLAALHPSRNDMSMYDPDGGLEGPDDDGVEKYWHIGVHPEDQHQKNTHITVHLDIVEGRPHRVWWERRENSIESHKAYLAWGCKNIFERHCRLMGFIPAGKDRSAERIGQAMDAYRTNDGVLGSTILSRSN